LTAPTPPPMTVSPISRTDTASAASTIYNVQYNTLNLPVPPISRERPTSTRNMMAPTEQNIPESTNAARSEKDEVEVESGPRRRNETHSKGILSGLGNAFKRRQALPPAEVRQGQVIDPVSLSEPIREQPIHQYAPWDFKGRIGAFAADHGERWRERGQRSHTKEEDLPVTIIPAQRRPGAARRPWSPASTTGGAHTSPMSNRGLLGTNAQASISEAEHESMTGAISEVIRDRVNNESPIDVRTTDA